MATRIFPSQNDVHDTVGQGRKPTEANLTGLRSGGNKQLSHYRNGNQIEDGGVLTGFDFSAGTATSITLTAGTAMIQGYNCEETTTISGTLTANMFNFVFLTVDLTSSLAVDLVLTVVTAATLNASITPPSEPSILLWCFETDGTSIVGQYDFRQVGSGVMYGSYVGNDAATRTFLLGFRPKLVQVYRNEDPRFIAQSGLAIPRAITVEGMDPRNGLIFVESVPGYLTPHMTEDPEIVPILHEDGFSVEDGPGTINGPILLTGSVTFNPGSIAAESSEGTTISVPGAQLGDVVVANHDGINNNALSISGEVTSANTVTVEIVNPTNSAIGPANGTAKVLVFATGGVDVPKLNELNVLYYFIAWF